MLEENLKNLTEDLELPSIPSKDGSSNYVLSLAEDLTLFFKSLNPGFFLFANITPLPSQKREEFFMYFMQGNLLGQGTGDHKLGIDAEERFLTLSHQISYDINYTEFKNLIEDFVGYLDYWRFEINKLQHAADSRIM